MTLPLFLLIRKKELITFIRQLAIMVSASVPVVEALKSTTKQTNNKTLKSIVHDVTLKVEGGTRLSQALDSYPQLFSSFFVNMVKSGETTGRLDEVLNYLADQQEKEHDMLSRIQGALIYPAFIFFSLIAVAILMLVFVLPQLIAVLQESGAALPISTRILIAASNFMTSYWWLILILVIGCIIGFLYGKKTPQGKIYWDLLKVKTPILGSIFRRLYLVRFSRNLRILLIGGVPLANALEATSDVIGNYAYKDVIMKTVKEVRDGRPLTAVFETSNLFPKTVNQILAVGEQAGKLNEVLLKLANFYTLELEAGIRTLISLIEPLILVIMGIGVGIMVASVILPMYQMASQF